MYNLPIKTDLTHARPQKQSTTLGLASCSPVSKAQKQHHQNHAHDDDAWMDAYFEAPEDGESEEYTGDGA